MAPKNYGSTGSPRAMKDAKGAPRAGKNAFGRDGGAAPRQISEKIERTAVPKSSLKRNMPA